MDNPKLRANRRRARRKGYFVMAGAVVAFLVPALLLSGFDLGDVLFPTPDGGGRNATATSHGTRQGAAPAGGDADGPAFLARALGFGALGVAAFAAYAGSRRHLRMAPRYRKPPWLTTHFTLSVAAMVLAATHGLLLMSGKYHGQWPAQTLFGVAALLLLGGLGATGVVLAKWFPLRWDRVRRIHYWLMAGMIAAGVVHVIYSSTTLHDLVGY